MRGLFYGDVFIRKASSSSTSEGAALGLTDMDVAPVEPTLVLAACHSLVLVENKVRGDGYHHFIVLSFPSSSTTSFSSLDLPSSSSIT